MKSLRLGIAPPCAEHVSQLSPHFSVYSVLNLVKLKTEYTEKYEVPRRECEQSGRKSIGRGAPCRQEICSRLRRPFDWHAPTIAFTLVNARSVPARPHSFS